jgi:potassium channel subfamily K
MREEEQGCPVCKQEIGFTSEEEKEWSEYKTVERIVKARAEEGFRSREREREGEEGEGRSECSSEWDQRDSGKAGETRAGVGKPQNGSVKDESGRKERQKGERGQDEEEGKDERELELHLRRLMELTVRLEAEARHMLLDSMEKGVARTLLLADRNGE